MNFGNSEDTDRMLADWILNYFNRLKKRQRFTMKQMNSAIWWAHEAFIIEHLREDEPELDLEPEIEPEPESEPEPELEPEPEPESRTAEQDFDLLAHLEGMAKSETEIEDDVPIDLEPVKTFEGRICPKCEKIMMVENRSRARYTLFVLWKCVCRFWWLEKIHDFPDGNQFPF